MAYILLLWEVREIPGMRTRLPDPNSPNMTLTQNQKLPFGFLMPFHLPIRRRVSILSNGSSKSHVL